MPTHDTEHLSDFAPSAKLVYTVLEHNGELTQKQIVDESLLSPRTTRYALTDLTSAGIVEEEVHFADARQKLYRVAEHDSTGGT